LEGAGPSEEFTTITISGSSCVVANTYTVTGLQTIELPGGETALGEHEFVAKKSGSKIKLGAEPASVSTSAVVHLTSGGAFLIMLGV
jgi:hypothetical protein